MILSPAVEQMIIKTIADDFELDIVWSVFAKTTLQKEREFKPVLRRLFRDQEKRVLQKIQQHPPPEPEEKLLTGPIIEPWLLNPTEWEVVFENAAKPYLLDSMEAGFDRGIRRIENLADVSLNISFDVHDPNVERMFNDKLHKFSFEVNDTTNKELKRSFREAIIEGENIRMINERASKVFRMARGYRTVRIARTEILGAYGAGNYRSMVDSRVVETRRWLATRDSRTRDSHADIDGEVVKLKQRYSNGLRFPGDWTGPLEEFINCRCTEIVESFVEGEY